MLRICGVQLTFLNALSLSGKKQDQTRSCTGRSSGNIRPIAADNKARSDGYNQALSVDGTSVRKSGEHKASCRVSTPAADSFCRIQVLSYDPSADTIEIVAYNRKSAQNNPIYGYTYMVYSRIAEVSSWVSAPTAIANPTSFSQDRIQPAL